MLSHRELCPLIESTFLPLSCAWLTPPGRAGRSRPERLRKGAVFY